MSKKYVIFHEIESEAPLGEFERPELLFMIISDAGYLETAMRSRATEYTTPRAAYAAAGRYPALADWQVGVR